ncbi:MAG: Mth938-like domain-containing protein [Gallionellaceae bacterium]|nr:Mth938-like domain-containing protein [Gallionellaceae bacterium]
MKLHLANLGDTKMFTAHGPDHVMVSGERYTNSIVVSANEVRSDWDAANFDGLNEAHFAFFLTLKPEILLLGTGPRQRFPHPRLYHMLTDAGIALECMDTPAACRTYNILVAEDRKVVAGILLEPVQK